MIPASPTGNSNLPEYPSTKGIILPIVSAIIGLLGITYIGHLLQQQQLPLLSISTYQIINFTFTMQLYVLPLSFAGLAFIFIYDKHSFRTFFRFRLKAEKGHSQDWQSLGPIVAVTIVAGTAVFMSHNVITEKGTINGMFFKLLPLVILFAATNAWTEEILSRLVIVAGLHRKVQPVTICWISAAVFGIPHYFLGTPNGAFGVVMSGLLGWFMAKSVVETKSMGWALLIHFLTDIVIFGAGAMIIAGTR